MDFTATQQNTLQTCDNKQSPAHVAVVMVPLPAQGHLNQLLHLSRLVSAYDIPVHYVGAATHIRQAKLRLHGWNPTSIYFHEFPTTPFENPRPDPFAPHKFPSQIVPALLASMNLREPVYEFVDGLSRIFRRVIVIYDFLMSHVVQDMGCIQNVDCYIFRSISSISVCSWEESKCWTPEAQIFLKEIPSVIGYYSEKFSEFLSLQYNARNVSCGEIFNSNSQVEGLFLDLLLSKCRKNIWALGPFNPTTVTEPSRSAHKCLDWLNKHAPNSVIYVSFGTSCSFSDAQVREIAVGLERSGQKFVWVLRDADRGDIFTGDVRETRLPVGFEERVRERGIIVKDWAPQLGILRHESTGGFVSHCGWNSCLESLTMGVPIAAWPMHSDQPANAVLVTRVLKVGILIKSFSSEEELVESSRIEKVVRELMGSDEMRRRAVELGGNVRESMMEGGDTRKKIDSFIAHVSRL
ncbi:hypothetical protein ACS0TY_025425 [Phlomoides rotata]